ncbi:MAG: PDZ domain-containing protein [Nitrospiraceae bacterium]|nr:PDZ domain-containing protein [Nitrospiraceae bacterium]MDA8433709.1 PDZ domain-containing protein [Nitrospiraceae bacterium]
MDGIREGDLIVAINGEEVTSVDQIHHFLAEWPIGKAVRLSIIRGQERLEKEVTTAEDGTVR